jgi:hypothetical protein
LSDADLHQPTWEEFEERPVAELELRSPAAELAEVLQRSRANLEAAARAGAESRAQGLRALAEQAVLAVELENVLDRHPAWEVATSLYAALRGVKERMLLHIATMGLEVVRLRGASASNVRDIIEVESWRYDDAYASEVVVDELEVAVRLDGTLVRMGRVVIGAPCNAPSREGGGAVEPTPAPAVPKPRATPTIPAPHAIPTGPSPSGRRIVCPVAGCGAENDAGTEVCVGCLTHLAGYIRLLLHPRVLFNRGLRAARAGDSGDARDCFAAVVLWQPDDLSTRNAYALACMDARDRPAARRAWEEVLSRSPRDSMATRGLSALARMPASPRS